MSRASASRARAILLAAGRSRRFGSDKRRVRLAGEETMLQAALRPYLAVLGRVLLVLRHDDRPFALAPAQPGVEYLQVPPGADGIGDSLAAAVRASVGESAILVGLADKPFVSERSIALVLDALAGHPLVVPCCDGDWGHPVGFRDGYFADLAALGGDQGARSLLQRERHRCHFIETGDPGVVRDVDRPDQLGSPHPT